MIKDMNKENKVKHRYLFLKMKFTSFSSENFAFIVIYWVIPFKYFTGRHLFADLKANPYHLMAQLITFDDPQSNSYTRSTIFLH